MQCFFLEIVQNKMNLKNAVQTYLDGITNQVGKDTFLVK